MIIIVLARPARSCKKEQNTSIMAMVQLTEQDNGKSIIISKEQTIKITLRNPGDGGYAFNEPEYNSSIVSFNNHAHTLPKTYAVGGFGTDTWEFRALKTGATKVTITAFRSFEKNNPMVMFTATIVIN
jgi:predicted secreted protein